MKKRTIAAIFTWSVILFASCKKETTEENAEELITTLKVTLTDFSAGTSANYFFRDPDGDAGNPPTVFDEIILKPNTEYRCVVEVLNESVSPAVSLNTEISTEALDHQFYYIPSAVNLTVSSLDTDAKGLPVGLSSIWTTGAASTGKIQIILKHKPGSKASGDPVTKGETDIELPLGGFVVKVQ